MSFKQVKKIVEPSLLKTPGVVGVGGTAEKIHVYVEGSPEFNGLPRSIAGYTVEVIKVGHVKALNMSAQELVAPLEAERTMRVRPVPGGVSIGHPSVTAGTMGTAINIGGVLCGLSNNHILAAVSTLQYARARIGDVVLQPGKIDGGKEPDDVVGSLYRYVSLNELGYSFVDCALFKPASPDLLSPDILGIRPFTGIKEANAGMQIIKSGRTSGVTTGKVIDVDATMTVDYSLFQATFKHQIVSEFMASPGDSGSLTMDLEDYAATGLVYAGSEYITLHNHIQDVINAFQVTPPPILEPSLLTLLGIPVGLGLIAAGSF